MSIRKTKKRLKRQIAEMCAEFDYIEQTERTTIGKVFGCERRGYVQQTFDSQGTWAIMIKEL